MLAACSSSTAAPQGPTNCSRRSTLPQRCTCSESSPQDSHQRPRISFFHKHDPHRGFVDFSAHSVVYERRRYPTSELRFQSFKVRGIRHRNPEMVYDNSLLFQLTRRPGLAEHIRTRSPDQASRFPKLGRSFRRSNQTRVVRTSTRHVFLGGCIF